VSADTAGRDGAGPERAGAGPARAGTPAGAGARPGATPARPATPSTARAINDRVALERLAGCGPMTGAQLQEVTGLARPTVTELLARLQASGLIEQAGEVRAPRRGPNARLYAIAARGACVAGIDARLSVVHIRIADLLGATLGGRTVAIAPGTAPEACAEAVAADLLAAARAAGAGPLRAVTVGLPGLVDPVGGRVTPTDPRTGWHALLAGRIAARGLPPGEVRLENEVNLAAIAEHRILGPRGIDDFALLWLDSGVGAAVVLRGELWRGASGGAGEVGFLPVPTPESPGTGAYAAAGTAQAPGCGIGPGPRRTDLHALIGGHAVADLAARYGADQDGLLAEIAGRIALGAAAFALVLDPGVVVLGGEVARRGGDGLAARVERRLAELCPVPTRVVPTLVPNNPILTGAVATALDHARARLWP
jgi:predicted NBD/HSP70 family sugar kinase